MSDFLLELRCEEIPARMQAGARADLEKLFRAELAAAGVEAGEVTVWSTPRRLALIAKDLPDATEAVREELKGPRANAPEQALEGFLRKTGLTRDQLEERDGVLFAVIEKPGGAVKDVLAAAIPAIAARFPWPKSMRWGAGSISTESTRWVRPLSGVVAILGEDLVEFEIGGVPSGYATVGHRFHHPGAITIGSAHDYAEKLRACHVIVDHEERAALIRAGASAAASDAGLTLVEDEGLVAENAGLTEWPIPLLGRFDEAYLDVPPEVIQLTARVNQKYFVCKSSPGRGGGGREAADGGGSPQAAHSADSPLHRPADGPPPRAGEELANAFVCTANIESSDPAAVVDGNRKVLAARLSDARFFWEQDRKKTLAEHAEKLSRITFHKELGTLAHKADRIASLTRWLIDANVVKPTDDTPQAKTELFNGAQDAAWLCKADLVTEMVGEFPELQGLMGGYYARAEGLPDAVADAISNHYKPVGQNDEVPTDPVTVAVSLADKLDTLFAFFAIGEIPSGSRDPFALRRAAISIISILIRNDLRLPYFKVMFPAITGLGVSMGEERARQIALALHTMGQGFGGSLFTHDDLRQQFDDLLQKQTPEENPEIAALYNQVMEAPQKVVDFLTDRLKVQQREAGVRHDLIDAVFALGGEDDLVRLLARVKALQSFVGTEDGANLLAGYKRAANILKKEEWEGAGEQKTLSYTPEPAEKALIDALGAAEPKAEKAIEAEDFEAAMAALASLRAPIDRFFDEVTVNDTDQAKRAARLGELARFRAAVHKVADFSRIEG
jgi:glycyl-tRNA synthetase beta chain